MLIPLIDWAIDASRAFAFSIEKKNNPKAITQTPVTSPPTPSGTTVFADSQFIIYDNIINSRQLAFSCGGIPASTLITLTVPPISGTMLIGPPLPADATKFFDGTGQWDTVKDTDLVLNAAITTNDVTFTKHGFVPIAPNDTTKFLRGDATWATAGVGTHNLLSATHVDTSGAGTEAQGDIIYRDALSKWTNLPIGASTKFLKGGAAPNWGDIAAAELPSHDHTKHDNRQRTLNLPIGVWHSASATTGIGALRHGEKPLIRLH